MELLIQTFLFKKATSSFSVTQLYSLVNKTMELYLKFLLPEEVNMYEKKR